MLPPFLGAALLFLSAGAIGLAFLVALWAGRGRPRVRRRALAGAAAAGGLYAGFWILGLVLAGSTVVSPGREIRFCGLDCHLAVSVASVRRGPGPLVTVRFASNALRAPEWPGKLRYRLRDGGGREFAPLNAVPDTPLGAGETTTFELRFPADARPDSATLVVTWKGGLDYLGPGAGNVLVQRRRRLALPAIPGSGV
jgi:hypothetical protein